jgi:hypothetical protein
VKRSILLLTIFGWTATAASAEPVRLAQAIPALLPAHEISTIIRSAGFAPISPAMRRGDFYVLRATNRSGQEVRVIVNARHGEIVSAVPVAPAGPVGLPGERLGDWEPISPPGYVAPPGVYESGPPPVVYEGDRPLNYERRPMAPIPNAPPRTARAYPPEMADDRPATNPSPIVREERGEHGLLPPPPERFPSRVGPAPVPAQKPAAAKPAQRAAATPLPKPRPDLAAADKPGEVKADDAGKPAAAPAPTTPDKVDPRSLPH